MTDADQGSDFSRQHESWGATFARLSTEDRARTLPGEDLEQLALSAYMLGKDEECAAAWLHAHQSWLREGDARRAARCAFWQACGLFFRGELAPALGWVARGRRVLEPTAQECAEHGWLLVLTALPQLFGGDSAAALPDLRAAGAIGERRGDLDLVMLSRLGQGQALVYQQQIDGGMALLDEVMVAVTAGELSPIITGIAYCAVIATCQEVFDPRRAREWTAALTRWCDAQPDLVPYRGNCLVHRCEILQLQGAWPEALDAAQEACDLLAGPATWDTLGSAYYQLGELHRLRGDNAQAEDSYRSASQHGRDPEPGMSLLRLARGQSAAALAGIRRVLDEASDPFTRSRMLPAAVEIMLATQEQAAARSAAVELQQLAVHLDAPFVQALAAQATGAVLLAEGDARAALAELRRAAGAWRGMDAPYQVARVRLLLGLALHDLGDAGSADLEFDASRTLFASLGAVPDLEQFSRLPATAPPEPVPELSPREREVLALLATGKTNRSIADDLFISEKTVARHVSNIFTKLNLASRAEATAHAYRHGLAQ